jgi:hypothetical protein
MKTNGEPAKKLTCTMPGCGERAKGKGLCQAHYDQWYGRIRRQRDKINRAGKPFLKFENPYRAGTGYWHIFEILRQNQPLTTAQIFHRSKIELAKNGLAAYRVDYAFEVLRAKRHASKKGEYQMRQDARKRWHLIRDRERDRERGGEENLDGENL